MIERKSLQLAWNRIGSSDSDTYIFSWPVRILERMSRKYQNIRCALYFHFYILWSVNATLGTLCEVVQSLRYSLVLRSAERCRLLFTNMFFIHSESLQIFLSCETKQRSKPGKSLSLWSVDLQVVSGNDKSSGPFRFICVTHIAGCICT